MTITEATGIAKRFVDAEKEILPGYIFDLRQSEEFIEKYFFDLLIHSAENNKTDDPIYVGGPKGIIVNKDDGCTSFISFGEYTELKNNEEWIKETFHLLEDLKHGDNRLPEIKTRYNLNSSQLLEFLKLIKGTELDIKQTTKTLNRILNQVRNSG